VGRSIPLWIKNTFNPSAPGTIITGGKQAAAVSSGNGDIVRAVTSMAGMSLITVQGAGMIGVPGIAGRVFSAVATTGASVMMISQSSSEYNICFVVSKEWRETVIDAVRREFAYELKNGDISEILTRDVAVLAAVGEGMRGTPGVAGRLFGALGRDSINVVAIAQGSSELNISLVVEESQRVPAVRCIHREFIG
jgi:aspartate kinase